MRLESIDDAWRLWARKFMLVAQLDRKLDSPSLFISTAFFACMTLFTSI